MFTARTAPPSLFNALVPVASRDSCRPSPVCCSLSFCTKACGRWGEFPFAKLLLFWLVATTLARLRIELGTLIIGHLTQISIDAHHAAWQGPTHYGLTSHSTQTGQLRLQDDGARFCMICRSARFCMICFLAFQVYCAVQWCRAQRLAPRFPRSCCRRTHLLALTVACSSSQRTQALSGRGWSRPRTSYAGCAIRLCRACSSPSCCHALPLLLNAVAVCKTGRPATVCVAGAIRLVA